jgi:hypothetical protein
MPGSHARGHPLVRELTIPGTWGILARRQQAKFGNAVPRVTHSARCHSNQS